MNMGPQHPSAHGVFRAILTLEGETVVGVDAVIGYLHRCHEKLGETLTYVQYPSIASKTDYVAAMTAELAYVSAVELVGKIEVPRRAQWLRVLAAELQRVASHCLWLGTWCMDMGGALGGGATAFLYAIREREDILDLFEALTGARLLYGFHQPGGTRYDLPAGWAEQCRKTLDRVERRLDEYEAMLDDNTFFLVRTQGVGIISRELAQEIGVSGPLLRGSGVNHDLRKAAPYSSYEDFQFRVPVETAGDCFARYRVRMVEFRESITIARQVLDVGIGMVTYVTLLERKFAARMQSRIGPYYVGPHGLLQPIADAIKLMLKEDVVPTTADRWVYNLAPIVFLVPCVLIFATLPFAPGLGVADLNIGVLFFLAVSSLEIVGLFMGGWGSNNKYALLSAMRAVNQIISYDLPFVFAAFVPVVLAGSLPLSVIVTAQQGAWLGIVPKWFVFYPVIGQLAFVAYVVTTLAAENRVPFDILEAESELIAGFRVEYSGMKFALIQLGEYAHIIGTSFLGALLFLGAWSGPGPAWMGPIWFLLKAMFVFLLLTWVRWSFVRIRVDQILAISWKLLLPASLLLLMATAVVVVLRGGAGA